MIMIHMNNWLQRLIYGPDYDGDGIPDLDMIDYDNPIHSKRNQKKTKN